MAERFRAKSRAAVLGHRRFMSYPRSLSAELITGFGLLSMFVVLMAGFMWMAWEAKSAQDELKQLKAAQSASAE